MLEGGRNTESGDHPTLMRKGGPYAELFEPQAAGYARGPARASSGCRQPVQLRDPFRTPPDGSQGVGQRGRDRARSRCRSTSSGPWCEMGKGTRWGCSECGSTGFTYAVKNRRLCSNGHPY